MVDLVNDMLRHHKGFKPRGMVGVYEGSGANECAREYCAQPSFGKVLFENLKQEGENINT